MSNITKPNQKLPIFNYNKNKGDSDMITKYLNDTNKATSANSDQSSDEEKNFTKSHLYSTNDKIVSKQIHFVEDEELFATIEHNKCVMNALKEALNDNDKVRI
jgi:hypothetical protein